MKNSLLIILSLALSTASMAQVGIGTASPNPAAQLEISSTSKGLLLPRLTTAQRDAIVYPPAGLVIYNSTINKFQGTIVSSPTVYGETNTALVNGASPVSPEWEMMPGMPMPAYAEAQSFRPSVNSQLSAIEIHVFSVNAAGTFTLKIFAGDGVGGSLLSSQTVTITTNGFNMLNLTTPVNLTAGQNYTFQLIAVTGNINVSYAGLYPNGNAYQNTNIIAGSGFYFRTILTSTSWVDLSI